MVGTEFEPLKNWLPNLNMEFQSRALLTCHCSLFYAVELSSKSLSHPPRSILDGIQRSFSLRALPVKDPIFWSQTIPNLSIYGALWIITLGHREIILPSLPSLPSLPWLLWPVDHRGGGDRGKDGADFGASSLVLLEVVGHRAAMSRCIARYCMARYTWQGEKSVDVSKIAW